MNEEQEMNERKEEEMTEEKQDDDEEDEVGEKVCEISMKERIEEALK
jgi:hypothetical protein